MTSAVALLIGVGSAGLFAGGRREMIMVLFSVTALAGVIGGFVFAPHFGRSAADDLGLLDDEKGTLV